MSFEDWPEDEWEYQQKIKGQDDQDEDDAELFQLQQYEGRIEADRRQDAQVSRAAADYLRGGN